MNTTNENSVRVRFAPSPTGNVHIGNIRAAIFNWLFARHHGGQFLLRVEDTDRERSTRAAIETLLECMDWLGLDFDEPPVYQSQRTARHLEVAQQLLDAGHAHRDAKGGAGECVVFKMPREGALEFTDLVKGRIRKKAEDTQDFVIVRSDGAPVFHLANVVDDVDMAVTHVIRGDDHVENTFKHIQLFRALGAEPPAYAHLPMIVNNQGKPYSKRDGAAFVGEFKEQGFLPHALFNFLALLGWAPGDDRELLTRDELISAFTLDRCKSAAARFDLKKLTWMNGEYIRQLPPETFNAELRKRLDAAGVSHAHVSPAHFDAIAALMQPRTKTWSELPANCLYFFTEDYPFNPAAVEKRLKPGGTAELLQNVADALVASPGFCHEELHAVVERLAVSRGATLGAYVHPIRVAATGLTEGPGLFELLEILGRETVCARLRRAVEITRAV